MTTNNLRPMAGAMLNGTFRLTGKMSQFDQNGRPYQRLRLSDCSQDHEVIAFTDAVSLPEKLMHLELLTVTAVTYQNDGHPIWVLSSARRSTNEELVKLPVLQTLPRLYCPKPELLDQLIAAVRSLQCLPLKEFVKCVLEHSPRLEVFLMAPASTRYHHNEPAGLLKHSLEVARNTVVMCRNNEPEMSRELQEVAYIAGLFHDIGKTFTYDIHGKPTAQGILSDHADLTLEACAAGLAYLDTVVPDVAQLLRHIWTCASPGARYGAAPAITLARYVRDADAHSAMAENQRKAMGKRKSGFAKLGFNNYWLPSLDGLSSSKLSFHAPA